MVRSGHSGELCHPAWDVERGGHGGHPYAAAGTRAAHLCGRGHLARGQEAARAPASRVLGSNSTIGAALDELDGQIAQARRRRTSAARQALTALTRRRAYLRAVQAETELL